MSLHHMLRAAAGNSAAPSDPNFKNVSLLLTGDGTNGAQNNTFLDSSTNNFTITRNGNTTQGTFSPYGNLWSNYFDGNGDYLSAGSNAAFSFGTGAYTVEFWVNVKALSSQTFVVNDTTNGSFFLFEATGSAGFQIAPRGGSALLSGGYSSLSVGAWNHVVFVRSSTSANQTSIFVNGTRVANGTDSTNWSVTGPCQIGGLSANIYMLAGYMSNVRIVKGTAVYDPTQSTLTVPTTPLTAVSGTSLLTCQSNRFIDNSSNNFAITVNGNTSVQRFNPFNPTAPYSAATIGGSGYFDGTGDYLNTPSTGQFAPTGDFTVSCWYYPTALPTFSEVLGNYTTNTSTDWLFEVWANGTLYMYTNGGTARFTTAAGAIKIGQWHYFSMSRSGTTITGYLNGTSLGTYTQSGTFGSASKAIYIGSQASLYPITGYLSDVKLINGSAVTTVPTAPQTATTGTNLLLNFTNAGIPDAAMMNDLETVGNAQVSTSVKKYGTGSLAFDGSGDYLVMPSSPSLAFGTGDFTVEAWVYLNTLNTDKAIIDFRSSVSTFGAFYISGSGNVLGFYDGSVTASGTALAANTWYHVAYVRYGTTLYAYLNGVQQWTRVLSTNITTIGNPKVGADYTGSGSQMNGYIDDLRITKGYARYTANFTPPTAALPTN